VLQATIKAGGDVQRYGQEALRAAYDGAKVVMLLSAGVPAAKDPSSLYLILRNMMMR
jgi:hypothetical protein